MKLVPIELNDLELFERMFCDPVHMADLGGPQEKEKVPSILAKQVSYVEKDKGWVYKIIPEDEDWVKSPPPNPETTENYFDWRRGVGTLCLWEGFVNDAPATEIGWGVIPLYQHNGFATKALSLFLEKAKIDGRWGVIHAMTSINNYPSNLLCKKAGFNFIESCEMDYDERKIPANHYTI